MENNKNYRIENTIIDSPSEKERIEANKFSRQIYTAAVFSKYYSDKLISVFY